MDLIEWPPKGNERHPWEKARFRFFAGILQYAGLSRQPVSVLDVGAGDGWFSRALLEQMHPETTITCWDINYTMDDIRRFSSLFDQRIQYISNRPEEKFDLLLLLDVLEHIEEDKKFLSLITKEHLGDGSFVLVSLPAWQSLFSKHDEHLKHIRRYNPGQCRVLLGEQGLKILLSGGLFHSLILPRIFQKVLDLLVAPQHKANDIGDWRYGNVFTTMIEKGLTWDNKISLLLSKLKWDVPGLSWWALCKKQ